MKLYVGMDAGGTKTQVYVGEKDATVRDSFVLGSINHHGASMDHIRMVIGQIFERLRTWQAQIDGLCFSGAGVDTPQDVALYTQIFRDMGYTGRLFVCGDGLSALVGGNGGLHGAVLIAGTGSITLGVTPERQLVRVGGWGYKIDRGCSGYALAIEGIRAAAADYDGVGPHTQITQQLMQKLGLQDFLHIVDCLYGAQTSVEAIAALGQIVASLCETDAVARAIVDAAAERTVATLEPLRHKIGGAFDVSLCGGVYTRTPYLQKILLEKIQVRYPDLRPHLAYDNAAKGALLLACSPTTMEEETVRC